MSEEIATLMPMAVEPSPLRTFALVSPGLAFVLNTRDQFGCHIEGMVLVNEFGEFGFTQKNQDGSVLICFGLREADGTTIYPKNCIITDVDYELVKADPVRFIQAFINMEAAQQVAASEVVIEQENEELSVNDALQVHHEPLVSEEPILDPGSATLQENSQ